MITNKYEWIKGANYIPSYARNSVEIWRDYDKDIVEKELGYAKRLGLNSVRVFLSHVVYKNDPSKFLENLLHLVRFSNTLGIYTMPVVWDSCFREDEPTIDLDDNRWYPNPGVMYLTEEHWDGQKEYAMDIINLLDNEPGLLMWDIHNEPTVTTYIEEYTGKELEEHTRIIWTYVKHYCDFFRENSNSFVTVGTAKPADIDIIADHCDVLSFHDYSHTKGQVDSEFKLAKKLGEKYGKAVFCSEMSCNSRANPYDITIEIANNNELGYFMWELMIGRSFWNDRHGIVYPDGTVRDPGTVAALQGFFRNRNKDSVVRVYLNTEEVVDEVLNKAYSWLKETDSAVEAGALVLEAMSHLLEAGEIVPMSCLPTIKSDIAIHDGKEAITALMKEWIKVLEDDNLLLGRW